MAFSGMASLEEIAYRRSEEQLDAIELKGGRPPAEMRRIQCACGCGAWFDWRRGETGRPPKFASDKCRNDAWRGRP